MSYDFRGGWENLSGHHSPLCRSNLDTSAEASQLSVNAAIQFLLDHGVESEKAVMGIPFYGRGWSGASGGEHGLYTSTTGQSSGTWEAGVLDFWDIQANYLGQGYVRYWDDHARVPWIYDANSETVVSYEDVDSISTKAKYINLRNLGGAMVWELSGDKQHELLTKLNEEL